jgi:hypothetical protein
LRRARAEPDDTGSLTWRAGRETTGHRPGLLLTTYFSYRYDRENSEQRMTTLITSRSKSMPPHGVRISTPDGRADPGCPGGINGAVAASAAAKACLAVILSPTVDHRDATLGDWQAELKLAECSRALPLAWPLPEWLDDYRGLLILALAGKRNTQRREARHNSWSEDTREFLHLLLAGRDKSAAELIRTLTQRSPFSAETRRLQRVQALFALIRPAHSLAEALDFRIIPPQ